MKFEQYQNGVIGIMGEMSKTVAAEQQAEKRYKDTKKNLAESLREGITGQKGFDYSSNENEQQRAAARAAYNAEMVKHMEEFDKLTAEAFKLDAKELNADMCQLLQLVNPTSDELARLVIETKPENYTMTRVLFAQAKAHGIDLCDDAPAYLQIVKQAMSDYVGHCNGATVMEAYSDNWGAIVRKFGTAITKAGADYLASPGITAEYTAAVA